MAEQTVIDPVCGMEVDPASTAHRVEHDGTFLYFCSAQCMEVFQRNPRAMLERGPRAAGPAAGEGAQPEMGAGKYICPMCPGVGSDVPAACPKCGMSFEELAPRNFSFNSPYGACPECSGLGTRFEVDPDLVVPNPELSLNEGAINPWRGQTGEYFQRLLVAVAENYKFSPDTPWEKLKKAQQKILL